MIRSLVLLAAAVFLAGCSTPENLTFLKEKETAYHNSGRYAADFAAVAERARADLKEAARRAKPGEKLAIVFDIDETCLSNWPYLQKTDYSTSVYLFEKWAQHAECPVLPPTHVLYEEAKKLGVTVFFITGRREVLRPATERNLARGGYAPYAALYLRPESDRNASVIPYKSGVRRAIEAKGYKIVLNIGDQWSDLEGGAAQRVFKLPNPFYYLR